ncbi:hypothetical protein HPHPM2_0096 [Helicobacter pylori Hp M2]|uniref:Uncharacterized protein n=2 Tax=Helicobacter pylori TaxID=210 RepID=J0EGK2_HELPX|nr:hypothetical protein HPHPH24_0224 [Helicobacter pylori Hp H-24]EJB97838.1 hypothetical protein HPHPH34_0347 [Helicobacter pylori Hp H-34]EJC19528.1 hypothetical protein HPHPH24B_0120 [Helicobacter pylori Hp H-24b]EJC20563.1 hypothetical protein HPHPH24C_0113 [Helicobacter pylori Hp H-24c]EJC40396.1 hypothetical protein HPHPM1_0224 [Helicobacter pylori Hp M1]EJC42536.1 hypothetical protein HPHPM2_0096 [Helicobacter pylori Hp M2]EJC43755.1 hypothetical protein HPHPM3_0226 [Helicobacter pylor
MIGCKNALSIFNDPCLRIELKNFVWWKRLKSKKIKPPKKERVQKRNPLKREF